VPVPRLMPWVGHQDWCRAVVCVWRGVIRWHLCLPAPPATLSSRSPGWVPGLPLPAAGGGKTGAQHPACTAGQGLARPPKQRSPKWGAHGNPWARRERTLDLQPCGHVVYTSISMRLLGGRPQKYLLTGCAIEKYLETLLERREVAGGGRKLLRGGTVPCSVGSVAAREPVPRFGVAEPRPPDTAPRRIPPPHAACIWPAPGSHYGARAGAAGAGLRGRCRAQPVWDGEEPASFSRETCPADASAGPGARERLRALGEHTLLLTS